MAPDATSELTVGESAVSNPAVQVRGLVRRFGGRAVLDGLDVDIEQGEFVALLGASGCGKSTLLRILADLDDEFEGTVQVSAERGVAFQAPRLLPWRRVLANVRLALPGRGDRAQAEAALAEVGLSHRLHAWPKELSGGEAQRAALARALVRNPGLLLLDEPFGALDALTRLKAQMLVAGLWERYRQAVLLVTHAVEEAVRLADRVLVMESGSIRREVPVDLPRPRDPGDPGFAAVRSILLRELGVAETVPRPSRSLQDALA